MNEKNKKFKEEEMSDDSLAWVGWGKKSPMPVKGGLKERRE